ncbi:MAG: GNAT family N-acetyltransferase [Acetobacteraceae bacterium]|nr:GNAT family N-acetyltransferase [Acetobacteraceae bacterium]
MTAAQSETDGFRVLAAGPREGARLVAAVRRFHGESGRGIDPAQAMAVHALCSDPSLGRAWLLADGRGRDVGYALAYWRHSVDHGGRVAVLDDLWIDAALRARALGRRLTEAVLADMSACGARAVVVEADPADASAMAFYARLGFAAKGTTLLVRVQPASRAPLDGGC